MRNPAVRIACPGRGAARALAKRCVADPGPLQTAAVPVLQRIIPLRFMLRCARDTELPRRTAASCEETTFTCGRIRSLVSDLLLTMKITTRTCEPSARGAMGRTAGVIAGHSASKTRVNVLMTRQSIRFGKSRFFSMDARVKPAHDDSRMPRAPH